MFIKILCLFLCLGHAVHANEGLPLYYWQEKGFTNFGDYISFVLVERIVGQPVKVYKKKPNVVEKKLLAIGSILTFAAENDVVWGSGFNGKWLDLKHYKFKNLDIRAIRGPISRAYMIDNFGIECPEIYGDPGLLFPLFFPEFQRKDDPEYDYIIIPHYTEKHLFPKNEEGTVVYPTDPWDEVINKILNSRFVISSSLHGIILAEAYGIPARLLKITNNEPLFKYDDYYFGTGRLNYTYAISVEEALLMGGEAPYECNLDLLYHSFPFDYWQNL